MQHLEDYLSPLLERMHRSPVWFFGVLLVIVAIFGFLGVAIGWAYEINSAQPEVAGLIAGALVFIGLFILLVHHSSARPQSQAGSLAAEFRRLDETTISLIQAALDIQLAYVEAIIVALKDRIPDEASELDEVMANLKRQRDQILSDARRPRHAGN